MNKIIDFIKNRPYAAVNLAGAALILLTFFFEELAAFGLATLLILAFIISFLPILLIILVIINITAFFTIYNFKTVPGIILTVLGGSIGAILAVRKTGNDFPANEAVKIIFLIKMWLALWLFVGFLSYEFGLYDFSIFPN